MKILHLEMSRFFSRIIGTAADQSGCIYRNERSIEAGLAALGESSFDLLITAHILEDGRAENLLSRIAEGPLRDIPVIIVTADDSIRSREQFFALGIMDYLLKSDVIPEKIRLYFQVISRKNEMMNALRGFRVAVLDDSAVGLQVIRSVFQFYDINHSEYFQSPKAMLAAGDFDLYIIDLVMPEMTGDEVVITLREQNPQSGIIVVSGVSNRLSMVNSLALGADDYISKPFDARNFIARVTRVVRHLVLLQNLEDKNKQMEDLARRDSLTGLWNHGAIHRILEQALLMSEGRPLSILLFDIDDFKLINDRFGHQTGDEVLLASTELLSAHLRDRGEVGRYGGEEFLVVLPGETVEEAQTLAEHILKHFPELSTRFTLTASCGLSNNLENPTAVGMVEMADKRLYRAKKAGKNCVVSSGH